MSEEKGDKTGEKGNDGESPERKKTAGERLAAGEVVILYGSNSAGEPLDGNEASGIEKLLNTPGVVDLLFSETPEEYEKKIRKGN